MANVSLVKVIAGSTVCGECGWRKCEHDYAGPDLDRVRCPGGDVDSRFVLRVSLDDYAKGLPNVELDRTGAPTYPYARHGAFAPLVQA